MHTKLAGDTQPGGQERLRFPVGETLSGIYLLERVLGSGGMGTVYQAQDRVLNRKVAIKVAREGLEYSLRNEAQALAAIQHPAMVTVHALGRWGDVEYLVMERVLGMSLEAHLQQRRLAAQPFSPAETLDLLIRLSDGLAAVHRFGISHRDVKPANIMLAPSDRLVLMDFGLFIAQFDRSVVIAGTPEYIAPEVIAQRVSPGAWHLVDAYALGVIGYQLLVGRAPYFGVDAQDVMRQHLHEPVPDVAAVRADVPPKLAALIRELMAKEPSERPQNLDLVPWQLRGLRARLDERRAAGALSVMIVDDHSDTLELLRWTVAMEAPDAEIRTAADAEAALAGVRKKVPDVLLLDLRLPGLSGMELVMYLRGAGLADRCMIVVLSSRASEDDQRLLATLGVTRFLSKDHRMRGEVAKFIRDARRELPLRATR